MPRASAPLRLFTLLVAALQLLLPGIVSLGEARGAREGAAQATTAHVEAPGGVECPGVHAEDCALCQYLSTPRFGVLRPAALPVVAARAPSARGEPARVVVTTLPGALRPRAPPAS